MLTSSQLDAPPPSRPGLLGGGPARLPNGSAARMVMVATAAAATGHQSTRLLESYPNEWPPLGALLDSSGGQVEANQDDPFGSHNNGGQNSDLLPSFVAGAMSQQQQQQQVYQQHLPITNQQQAIEESDLNLMKIHSEFSPLLWIISILLSSIIFCTFVGNLFVIVAIKIDKNLQTTANHLVLSLACADLMVACLVMPLGAYNDIRQGWYLGEGLCEFWTSADVLCCTG